MKQIISFESAPVVLRLLLVLALHALTTNSLQAQTACDDLTKVVAQTYNFKPSKLTDEQRAAKSAAMDNVWNMVKARPAELTPCLRRELANERADPWFRFDGANLLVEVDSSSTAKELQVRHYAVVAFDDVDPRYWVTLVARRGAEGFDTSIAAERWLVHGQGSYRIPQHGGYEVSHAEASLYVFGSMDENFATPALARIVGQTQHPGRGLALGLLMRQATPEALKTLRSLDPKNFSSEGQRALQRYLSVPALFAPRPKPLTTRAQFISAFEQLIAGEPAPFFELVEEVPDGERDAVAVLKSEDVLLVRRVRRELIANSNPTAREFYDSFTKILLTLILKGEKTPPVPARD